MNKLTLNLTALNLLNTLIPVLMSSLNENGVIPFGAAINDTAYETISLLTRAGHISHDGTLSIATIARRLIVGDFVVIA